MKNKLIFYFIIIFFTHEKILAAKTKINKKISTPSSIEAAIDRANEKYNKGLEEIQKKTLKNEENCQHYYIKNYNLLTFILSNTIEHHKLNTQEEKEELKKYLEIISTKKTENEEKSKEEYYINLDAWKKAGNSIYLTEQNTNEHLDNPHPHYIHQNKLKKINNDFKKAYDTRIDKHNNEVNRDLEQYNFIMAKATTEFTARNLESVITEARKYSQIQETYYRLEKKSREKHMAELNRIAHDFFSENPISKRKAAIKNHAKSNFRLPIFTFSKEHAVKSPKHPEKPTYIAKKSAQKRKYRETTTNYNTRKRKKTFRT